MARVIAGITAPAAADRPVFARFGVIDSPFATHVRLRVRLGEP